MFHILMIYCLLSHLTWLSAADNEPPVLQEILVPSKSLIEGKKLYLTCQISSGTEPIFFEWWFNDKKIENNDDIYYNKIEDDLSSLTIRSLKIENSGNYTCKSKNSYGEDSFTIKIELKVKPRWIKEPKDITSELYKPVELNCEAKGNGQIDYRWMKYSKNGESIKTWNSNKVEIKNLTRLDASYMYKCVVSNEMGSIEKSIFLNIFVLQDLYHSKQIQEGQSAKLHCDLLDGKHPIQFSWKLNNKLIENNEEFQIIDKEDESTLKVKNLSLHHFGSFSCLAKNKFGNDEKQIKIHFNVKPRFSNQLSDAVLPLNSKVKLKCESTGIPQPSTNWQKLSSKEYNVEKEFNSDVLDFYLTKLTEGTYRCVSTNLVGSISKTIKIKYFGLSGKFAADFLTTELSRNNLERFIECCKNSL